MVYSAESINATFAGYDEGVFHNTLLIVYNVTGNVSIYCYGQDGLLYSYNVSISIFQK